MMIKLSPVTRDQFADWRVMRQQLCTGLDVALHRDMATDAELENTQAQDFYRRIGFDESWRIVEFTKPLHHPR